MPMDRTLTVIGSPSVGKSALTIRFIENKFNTEYDPTISATYSHNMVVNGVNYHLTVIDTAGLEPQGQIPHQYLKSHGFILVYSITDQQSFETINDIYDRLVEELGIKNVPLILIGNKSDLNEKRRISFDAGNSLAQRWRSMGSQASFIEASALTGDKVEDVFVTLLNLIDQHTDSKSNQRGGTGNVNQSTNANNNSNNQRGNERSGTEKTKQCTVS